MGGRARYIADCINRKWALGRWAHDIQSLAKLASNSMPRHGLQCQTHYNAIQTTARTTLQLVAVIPATLQPGSVMLATVQPGAVMLDTLPAWVCNASHTTTRCCNTSHTLANGCNTSHTTDWSCNARNTSARSITALHEEGGCNASHTCIQGHTSCVASVYFRNLYCVQMIVDIKQSGTVYSVWFWCIG